MTIWNSYQRCRNWGAINILLTWGKALVEWAASPEQALTWLTELNHRLAARWDDQLLWWFTLVSWQNSTAR